MNIQNFESRTPLRPLESNACMLNLCRRRFKVTSAYPRDAWNKGGGNLF
jgi:hypothetical protein